MANKKITIENASLTASINDIDYDFGFITSITLTDPRENSMSVSPQGKGDGLVFRINTTAPCTNDFIIRSLSSELYTALTTAFEEQTRIDFLLYDTNGGDQYELGQSVIRMNPSNASITEGEEALNVLLNTSCPPLRWKHTPSEEE